MRRLERRRPSTCPSHQKRPAAAARNADRRTVAVVVIAAAALSAIAHCCLCPSSSSTSLLPTAVAAASGSAAFLPCIVPSVFESPTADARRRPPPRGFARRRARRSPPRGAAGSAFADRGGHGRRQRAVVSSLFAAGTDDAAHADDDDDDDDDVRVVAGAVDPFPPQSSSPPPPLRREDDVRRRRSNKSLGKLAANRENWYSRLEELRTYIAEHGHCTIPPSHPGGLAGWVALQRSNHALWRDGKKSPLTDERREALDALDGFEWDVNDALWRSNLEDLRRYREDNGTADVPHSGGSLGRWVHVQRLEYHRWRRQSSDDGGGEYTGGMTAERAALLEGAGMVWDPRQRQFDEMADMLRRFKKVTGHIHVGAREGRLSAWFYRQRRAYRDMLEGKESTAVMTKERRAVLEELGFKPEMFSNRTVETDMLSTSAAKQKQRHQDKKQKKTTTPKIKVSWDDSFENLKLYRDENGHCNVHQLEGKLGRFVRHQRELMMERQKRDKRNSLTDERIDKLESIGFIWDLNEYRWNEKFEHLRKYADENGGDCNVPQSYGELGDWCETQREQYVLKQKGKSGILTDEREEALTQLGFTWRRGEQVKSRREETWNRHMDELREYKERFGHCRVPRSSSASQEEGGGGENGGENYGRLANWVSRQRTAYRSLLRGEKSTITAVRRAKLEEIGFE